MFWDTAKYYIHNNYNYFFKGLEKIVSEALNSIFLKIIKCYAHKY